MSKPKFHEEIITIKGMHCKSCSDKIESVIGSLDGVESIKVTLIENKAFVKFDPAKISLGEINSEIAFIGYSTGSSKKKDMTLKQGIVYGLVPHIGCIGFIAASILGVTVAVNFFKPLLMNPWFFHILVLMSIGFATISSAIYLRKQGLLSSSGIKRKWKYLSTMYGSTIGINLFLFMIIFPLLANVSLSSPTGDVNAISNDLSLIRLQVDIPCPGHAPLISGELKTISGVEAIQFSYPNFFDVKYDSYKTTKQEILSLDVFDTYRATVLSESQGSVNNKINNAISTGSTGKSNDAGKLATVTNGVQVVQLSVQGANYYPNPIRVKKGIQVQLVADMNNLPGCSRSIIIPEFGVRKVVSTGDNVIEFTPDKSGTFQFSCSMGMYTGVIHFQ